MGASGESGRRGVFAALGAVVFVLTIASAAPATAEVTNPTGTTFAASAGQPFAGAVAQFSSTDRELSNFSATIDWGDGTPTSTGSIASCANCPPVGYDVLAGHTYAGPGSFPVTVVITSARDGATGTATGLANVTGSDPPPPPPDPPKLIGGPKACTNFSLPGQHATIGGVTYKRILGTNKGEYLKGTDGADLIIARGGADRIGGGQGKDIICAGEGNDRVEAGPGEDVVDGDQTPGGPDVANANCLKRENHPSPNRAPLRKGPTPVCRYNDSIGGGNDRDFLMGELGHDVIAGEQGNDTVFGGSGDDLLWGDGKGLGSEADIKFCEKLWNGCTWDEEPSGHDIIGGGDGDDRLHAGLGDNNLYGDAGKDRLIGSMCRSDTCPAAFSPELGNFFEPRGFYNDYLSGGASNDFLYGSFFADRFDGGSGLQDTCDVQPAEGNNGCEAAP